MRKIYSLLIGVLLFSYSSYAAVVTGVDTSYIGEELVFYMQSDPFTGDNKLIGSGIVDSSGYFSIQLDVTETSYVYTQPGIYNLYLFVNPEDKYAVLMPLFKEKTKADDLNPFFTRIDVHLALKNFSKDELNIKIRMFLDAYIPYYNKHLDRALTDNQFEDLNKDIESMEKAFSKSKNEFFNSYREYKYGMLRMLAFQHKSKAISDQYFKDRPVLYKNPAYIELFNMVYDKYFTHFSRADSSKQFEKAMTEDKTYTSLKAALSVNQVLQPDELLNMVMIKCLFEEFYDDNYSREAMLNILNTFIDSEEQEIQINIASNIKNTVTRLMTGFAPPAFKLYDVDSNLVSLTDLEGKYVYLNFCSCFSYSCLNEFAMLQTLYDKHKEYIEIVTIVIDDDVEVMKDFVLRSGYAWKFLHFDNQPDVLFDYDVRMFPTYYLIDMEGKLVMSPAATPNENFEGRLFKELRKKGVL